MERDIKNKSVLITGGAQGIGFSIAEKFLAKGASLVILVDIDDERGPSSVQALNAKYGPNKAEFHKCDVTSDLDAAATKIFTKHTNIDVLVNNAGVLNEYSIQKTIGINVTALMEWSVRFFEQMRKDKGGRGGTVINLASIYGFRVDPFLPIYQGSKFAVMGFTKSFGHPYRYSKFGIRAVGICPGFTKTELVSHVKMNDDATVQKHFDEMLKGVPWQKVDSVSNAVIEVFQKGDSGTAWLIEGAKPIKQV